MPLARMGWPIESTDVVEVSYREIPPKLSSYALCRNGTATSQNGERFLPYLGTVPSSRGKSSDNPLRKDSLKAVLQ